MLITEFVEQVNSKENVRELLLERITRDYVPVTEKTKKLRIALNSSIISPAGGVPYVDMVFNQVLYFYTVVTLYTDLEPEKTDKGELDTVGLYDICKKNKLSNLLLNAIGDDLKELKFINEQVLKTWDLQNSSVRAFVSNTLKDFSGLSDAFSTKLEEIIQTLPAEENITKE